jgi:phosphatidylserine decarboxylase
VGVFIFWALSSPIVLIISAVIFFIYMLLISFFRDPEREISSGIVAPADGIVKSVDVKGNQVHISVFMNVWNVHVNRAPEECKVLSMVHRPGGYVPAFKKDSERNERVEYVLRTRYGNMKLVQIAGSVARRIVPYVREGDRLAAGEKLGIIRFGSRVDLDFKLPSRWVVNVEEGQGSVAGVTIFASGGRER